MYMPTGFNILDYVDKLVIRERHNTWIHAVCPVCGGKLKISLSNRKGAYACYTSECHKIVPNPIRNSLSPPCRFDVKKRASPKILTPKLLPFDYKSVKYTADSFFIKTSNYNPDNFVKTSVKKHCKITEFFYLSEQEGTNDLQSLSVVRVDKTANKSKSIYIKHTTKDNNGVVQTYNKAPKYYKFYPFFRKEVIQPFCIFVEGEKCAYIAQKRGLAAFSLLSYMVSETYLPNIAKHLKDLGVTDILLLRDNDHPGLNKATLFAYNLYKKGIRSKIVNVAEYAKMTDIVGYDIADYLLTNSDLQSIINLLEWCIYE